MDALEKEFNQRRGEIKKSIELFFKANMKFTNWDIPEVDDTKAAKMLMRIMKDTLSEIEEDIENGKYENY